VLSARSLSALLVILACASAQWAPAAPAPGSVPWQPLEWRSIGPYRGGRVLAVTGVPGEPDHFYFGAVNGGVWETLDAGRTWQPIFDAVPIGSIGAIAVAPSDARVVYVGTGEADMRSDIAQGAGLYRSRDAGHTWQAIGLEDSQQIGRIVVDPNNADTLLVAALGHPYGANETRGVYRSTDGGASWHRTLYRDADTGAIDLAFEPGNAAVVYAALWQTRRPPWNVYPPSSGPGGGLYQSHDGGQTWTELTGHGLPQQPGRIGIAVAPSKPARVYALVDAAAGGLYRSDDAGASWTRVSDDARIWKRGWYFGGVTVDPDNPDIVYVCDTGVYRSSDGGHKFLPVKGAPGGDDYHVLWIDPQHGERRILGVDQGAVITLNGGSTWSSWFNQPTGQFYHVITDNRFPYWVYGAQQDSGAAGVPSRTDNIDGINLTQFRETAAGGESDNIAPDPLDPQIIFGGRVDRLETRSGEKYSVPPPLAYPGLYRGTWTLPLVFSAAEPHALYFGNQRIFRTIDRGRHWQVISPDLSRESPAVPANLDAATVADHDSNGARRGVVYSIGPSPLKAGHIWAGTDDGLVWRTVDGGAHWRNVTPAALTDWSKIGVVEPSHFDAETAYIAVDRHRLDDRRPYIYRTHDGGASWTLIVDGIVDGGVHNSVNVVREDPARPGLLYCGTEYGAYVSLDDGAHWQTLQQNLPRTSVRDLVVHGADLVIATHGRGFWIMDDVAPLRALAEDGARGTRLLPPATAVRVRPTGFLGSPMPKDEPRGANPPAGAYIDYSLDASVTGPVELTVRDAGGALVRTFSSDDAPPPADLGKSVIAPEWLAAPQRLAAGAGAHRFLWNLHYAPSRALMPDEGDEPEEGVWAPPGTYAIELRAAGQVYRETLNLTHDPRITLPAAAYARQFALARDVERARGEIATTLAAAEKIQKAMHEPHQVGGAEAGAGLLSSLAAAETELRAITDAAPEKRSPDSLGAAPTTVGGLRYLGTAFQSLAQAVDGADAAPTVDAERGYVLHRALLDAALAKWAKFRSGTLAQLNAQLEAAGAAAITP
jgi:photosystem II stability/assembly factor-like uncharacterized protein